MKPTKENMMNFSNVCPACMSLLNSVPCGNDNCKSCTKEVPYERLILHEQTEDNAFLACPKCGYVEEFSFWEVQNIELFIIIQMPTHPQSLTKASDLYQKRKKKINDKRTEEN